MSLRPSPLHSSSMRKATSNHPPLPSAPQGHLPEYFQIPKKKSTLTIKSPAGEAANSENELPESSKAQTAGRPPQEIQKHSNQLFDPPSVPDTDNLPIKRPSLGVEKLPNLNIYAPIHVPDWLIAINESVAMHGACLRLPSFDTHDYAIKFGAFAHTEPILQRPPSPVDDWTAPAPTLEALNYQSYFLPRIRNENIALGQQMAQYSLYQHNILLNDLRQFLYEIRVPGLRENSPRLDLGDTVLVRPINVLSPAAAIGQNKIWREQMQARGIRHPAFLGTEFRAKIWGIHRATETVVLRIDNGGFCTPTANFRFFPQAHNTEPLLRIVTSIDIALSSSDTLRSMLFPQRSDACMQTKLSPSTFDLAWWDQSLNFEQQKAVANVAGDRYGAVPYLISGPPGTGKTKTLVETALQLIARKKSGVHPHLLICAPSDAAADTLALRLAEHLNKEQMFRLNGWNRTFAEVPDKLMLYSYAPHNIFGLPPFHQLMSYSVIITTCRDSNMLVEARLTNRDLAQLAFHSLHAVSPSSAKTLTTSLIHWTALLLDEAAQATEPESLVPLSVILPLWQPPTCKLVCPQFVLAGDEFQLGPRLASHAQQSGLEISLFQRLSNLPFYAEHPLSRANGLQVFTRKLLPLPRAAFTNLIRNYRSHPAILSVPSSLFYYDTLVPEFTAISQTVSTWRGWPKACFPVLFIQNNGADEVDDILVGDGTGAGSLYNNSEINVVLRQVQSLLNGMSDLEPEEILVMSPFRAQVARIRLLLRKEGFAAVNVGPLEAFQGLEGRIVILCTTRTRRGKVGQVDKFVKMDRERGLGVVDEPKRFNVAITRAMEGLIVVGDARTLVCTGDDCWRNFVAFCVRNELIEGNIAVPEQEMREWDVKEGRLERALRQKEAGVESGGVIGLRGFVEPGEEEGEMTLPENEEEVDDGVESQEELGDEYQTLEGLNLDGAVM